MKLFFSLAVTFITLCSCSQKTKPAATVPTKMPDDSTLVVIDTVLAPGTLPLCVQRKIDSIKQLRVWNPPAQVDEYMYDGKKVYLFSADCCDQFPPLFDANCEYLCAPSGGFTGKGDGNCTDFNAKAKHVRSVWKDSRVKK